MNLVCLIYDAVSHMEQSVSAETTSMTEKTIWLDETCLVHIDNV